MHIHTSIHTHIYINTHTYTHTVICFRLTVDHCFFVVVPFKIDTEIQVSSLKYIIIVENQLLESHLA